MRTWIIASITYFLLRTYVSRKHPYLLFPQLALSQILLGSLLPLLTLELINFSKFCYFSNFLQVVNLRHDAEKVYLEGCFTRHEICRQDLLVK